MNKPSKRRSILLVEDNADSAEALTLLLESLGHEAIAVGDGRSAIDAVRSRNFELALVDIGLPGMDGYEVARSIRKLPSSERSGLAILNSAISGNSRQKG